MNCFEHRLKPCELSCSKSPSRSFTALLFCSLSLALVVDSTSTLVSQVLKGRIFGSHASSEIPRRVVVDEDGFLYIAGITKPSNPDESAWGDVEAGEVTGKGDIFLAKFSMSAELLWVKRTGSSEEDVLNDLKIANDSLYFCGSTEGSFGSPSRGSADGFIMKFTLEGEKAWRRPYQFGTDEYDSCNALEVDSKAKKIYVVGITGGRLYGTSNPPKGMLEPFVASFDEFGDSVRLKLAAGRQTSSSGNSSGDAIAFASDDVLMMTTEWDERLGEEYNRTTYLNVLDRATLLLQKRYDLRSLEQGTFCGFRMVVPGGSGDVFIIGKTKMPDMTQLYHVILFNEAADEGIGGVVWATRVGKVSKNTTMIYQIPAIAVDAVERIVYVAGVEDGFFIDPSTVNVSGIILVPFLKIQASSGRIDQRWHRSTTVPGEKEELTDIALGPGMQVVYTGVWEGGPSFHSNALIGSFGSPDHISRETGSVPVATSMSAQAGGQGKEAGKNFSHGKVIIYSLLGLGVVGIALTALIARGMWSPRKTISDDESVASSDMEEIRRQIADAHRDLENPEDGAEDVVVGGSAGPR